MSSDSTWEYFWLRAGLHIDLLANEDVVAAREQGWGLDKAIYDPVQKIWHAFFKRPKDH
jgi:hypothetical protein